MAGIGRRTVLLGGLAAAMPGPGPDGPSARAQTPPSPSGAQAAPTSQAFQLGVLPNISARIILQTYQPVRAYLEPRVGRPIEVVTAPDFRAFHQRTMAGAYDLVVTAANLGRVAELAGLPPAIAIYDPPIPGLLVMYGARPIASVADLAGKTLALANPQSLVALRGLAWLAEQGLDLSSVRQVHARNDDSLGQLLASGEAPLAMMSGGEFRAIGEGLRSRLQVFREFARVPGFFVLPGKPMPAAEVEQLAGWVLGLPASPEGQEFMRLANLQAIRRLTDADRAGVDGVVAETRRLLGQG
ncbi:MAG: PhnD/SsuA/transferrin family substrate-binding protein [Alphaproteobacteria bacterium]|nr:PhnD/SsuA/transferrin family substrate-binding protein [Alphaproteobacteria bacterium]